MNEFLNIPKVETLCSSLLLSAGYILRMDQISLFLSWEWWWSICKEIIQCWEDEVHGWVMFDVWRMFAWVLIDTVIKVGQYLQNQENDCNAPSSDIPDQLPQQLFYNLQ